MLKKRLHNQNEDSEQEELEDDPELKELESDDLGDADPKSAEEDENFELEDEVVEAE